MPSSRGSSQPRSPVLQADSLPSKPQGKPKSTGVGSLYLLQQIFLTQESNRGLLHCRRILYQLSYHRSPKWVWKQIHSQSLQKRTQSSQHQDFNFVIECRESSQATVLWSVTYRTMNKYICVVFSHAVCSSVLWQQQKTNILLNVSILNSNILLFWSMRTTTLMERSIKTAHFQNRFTVHYQILFL